MGAVVERRRREDEGVRRGRVGGDLDPVDPQRDAGEAIGALIEDPWRVFACEPDPTGCRVRFDDPEFVREGRDAVYYVRAIEEPSRALNADPIACAGVPDEQDCAGEVEERAWSSPIFVDFQRTEIAGLR